MLYDEILSDYHQLYEKFKFFLLYWSAHIQSEKGLEGQQLSDIVESQYLYGVRGNRYQIFELEPIKSLLPPHDQVLLELFGVSADDIRTVSCLLRTIGDFERIGYGGYSAADRRDIPVLVQRRLQHDCSLGSACLYQGGGYPAECQLCRSVEEGRLRHESCDKTCLDRGTVPADSGGRHGVLFDRICHALR